ncbi:unnamed protein product, partial [Mesorhabditis spiculigera]
MIHRSPYPSVPLATEPLHVTLLRESQEAARKDPEKAAFINAFDYADRISYRQLLGVVDTISAFLHNRGFRRETAAVVLPNCWQWPAFFLAAQKRAGVVSGASALFTDYELQRQFLDSKASLVLTGEESLDKVLKASAHCPLIKTILVVEKQKGNISGRKTFPSHVFTWEQAMETKGSPPADESIHLDDDLTILPYSSGTTGSPKGVMITHGSFATMIRIYAEHWRQRLALVLDKDWDMEGEHRNLFLPFYHCYGMAVMICSLWFRATGIIHSRFEPDTFCRALQDFKTRYLAVVPPILVFLAKHSIPSKYDLSAIEETIAEVCRRFPAVRYVAQGYGMTEMSLGTHFPDLTPKIQKMAAVGKLSANNEMKIVDPGTNRLCNIGERGEIAFKGPTVMKGYLGRDEATRESIVDGWLHTGDIGYVDEDGDLFVVDRLKELIKVKGLQVPPAELEDLLLSHPKIRDAAVIGIPDARAGELPRAYVVRADDSLTEQMVADFVKEKASAYKQLKGGVEFIDEVPKSAAGKILRRTLRDRVAQRAKL